MTAAISSLFTGRQVRNNIGMTGEVTLRGRVLPVGGVKAKVLAAHRAGLDTVVLPKQNAHDLEELPEIVRERMTFVPVDMIEHALEVLLEPKATGKRHGRAKAQSRGNGSSASKGKPSSKAPAKQSGRNKAPVHPSASGPSTRGSTSRGREVR
jgi:ATP-dependent Lon protease